MTRPPRLTSALLRLLLDADAAEVIAGDLEEAFHDDLGRRPVREARRRYRRHAAASLMSRWRPSRPDRDATSRPKGDGPVRGFLQDVRYGARLLARHPGFTAVAAAMLAVGIGGTTAIFSVANTLLLKPLPYHDPDRVAFVLAWNTRRDEMAFTQPLVNYVAYRDRAKAFGALAAYQGWSVNVSGGDLPERVQAYRVTTTEFPLLGVEPLLGRWFRAGEGVPGGGRVVVLGYGLWQRRFAGRSDVLGRDLRLDGVPYTIVGVMPASFEFPVFNFKGDLWTPLEYDAAATRASGRGPWVVVNGRLAPGATLAQAQAEMNGIASRLAVEYPQVDAWRAEHVIPMHELGARMLRPMILAMFVAVGLVLLIACSNVANLTLARGLARQKEVAVRAALGAGRLRVLRQFVTENLLLAAIGGLLGLAVARGLLSGLLSVLPPIVSRTTPGIDRMGLDGRVLLFALAVSIATPVLFGLLPAWHAVRPEPQDVLKEGGRLTATPIRRRLRGAFVVGQVALSMVLLVSAGLMVRSMSELAGVDPGFDADSVLAMSVTLPASRYPDDAARRSYYARALDAVQGLPGVRSAAFVNLLPFSTSNDSTGFTIEGVPPPAAGQAPGADFRCVTPDYFRTLAIPLRRGRMFRATDTADAARVVVVNETLARRYFPDGDAIGRRIRFGGADATGPWRTIVGVIGDVRHWELTRRAEAELYMPLAQDPEESMTLVAKIAGTPLAAAPSVRDALATVDRDQPVFDVTTLDALVGDSLLARRLTMQMMSLFGLVALALAALGLYGVVAYSVTERAHDLGVRVALGASPRDISELVVRGGFRLALAGITIGLVGAGAASRLLTSLLYGVEPLDPATYAAGAGLLVAVSVLATWIPARRAMRVDPIEALREG